MAVENERGVVRLSDERTASSRLEWLHKRPMAHIIYHQKCVVDPDDHGE